MYIFVALLFLNSLNNIEYIIFDFQTSQTESVLNLYAIKISPKTNLHLNTEDLWQTQFP